MTSNESVSALRSCMNAQRLRLLGAWLLAVGGGAALAGLVLTNQTELWASAAVVMLGV